ncbi:MAG: DUF6722 family protein [Candidatus Desantisbacteria bacterium]
MKYSSRRKEIGKMFVDVAKYILTIGIIGSLFTDRLTIKMAMGGVVASVVFLVVAFFVIPQDGGE